MIDRKNIRFELSSIIMPVLMLAWLHLITIPGYSQSQILSLAGRWAHGNGSTIAAQDSRVYYNDGGMLVIADTDSAGAITNRRIYQRPGMIKGIAVRDSLLYTVNGKAGFQILNISDPDHPIEVASLPIDGDAFRVRIQGDYAFAGSAQGIPGGSSNEYGIHIIDISDPDNPVEISYWLHGQVFGYTWGTDLSVGTQHFYSSTFSNVVVVDFSDPGNPAQVGTIVTPANITNIALANGYLYISRFGSSLLVYNVSNPASPVLAGELMGTSTSTNLEIQDNLMVLSRINSGVRLIDLSDPVNPQLLLNLFMPAENCVAAQSAIRGDRLYLASVNDTWAIDISDPAAPAVINSFPNGGTANAATVTGNKLYVASSTAGFNIVDVSDPAQPLREGKYLRPGGWLCRYIIVQDGIAYTAGDLGFNGYFSLYDVSDPANIIPLGASTIPGALLLNIRLKTDHAFIADRVSGVRIYNISNPAAPQSAAIISGTEAYHLAISGDNLFVAALGAGLKIYDISNPAQPVPLGTYNTAGTAQGVAVSGNTAFVADGEGGLRIIDVTDPAAPAEIAFLDAGNNVLSVDVRDGFVYLGTADGLLVADVSNPTLPQPLEWFSEFDEAPYSIHARDEAVYIAGGGEGVYILRNSLVTSLSPAAVPLAEDFRLSQNYPNPFNPETRLSYALPRAGRVKLQVFNAAGQLVQTLKDGWQNAGVHTIQWQAGAFASGVYFFKMQAGEFKAARKGILLK